MKTAGIILFVLGIVGVIVFGIQAANDSETFSILGLDVAVSEANWTPLIISLAVTLVGVFLTFGGRKSARN